MDDADFIPSLSNSLQSLCSNFLKFKDKVHITGHLFFSVDYNSDRMFSIDEKLSRSENQDVSLVSRTFCMQSVTELKSIEFKSLLEDAQGHVEDEDLNVNFENLDTKSKSVVIKTEQSLHQSIDNTSHEHSVQTMSEETNDNSSQDNLKTKTKHKRTEKKYVTKKPRKSKSSEQDQSKETKLVIKKERIFTCQFCGIEFKKRNLCEEHERIHTGVKPFVCDLCGKWFRCKKLLNVHTPTHSDDQPFECKLCKKRFKLTLNLNKHMRVHSGEKPFICDLCGVSFARCDTLSRHRTTHTGEQNHKCDICTKVFSSRKSLKRHLMIHSGQNSFVCLTCGAKYSQNNDLKVHTQRLHTNSTSRGSDTNEGNKSK